MMGKAKHTPKIVGSKGQSWYPERGSCRGTEGWLLLPSTYREFETWNTGEANAAVHRHRARPRRGARRDHCSECFDTGIRWLTLTNNMRWMSPVPP